MIIAIGTRIQIGPFGGGNQFAQSLRDFLEKEGTKVIFDLEQPYIDVILVTSVKPWGRGTAFDIVAALQYVKTHPRTKIVLRVNECDERKGYTLPLLNNLLRASMKQVDHTVFVSQWLRDTLLHPHPSPLPANTAGRPIQGEGISVIRSGADPAIFNPHGQAIWDGREPLKIVTHHWSRNWYKGWDVYQKLDNLTFIGPPKPLVGKELAAEIKRHHVYISASQNEPAGMHYIEALQCGLPILYRKSGSLPEYCAPYGIGFSGPDDIINALEQMRREYTKHQQATQQLRYTADDMNRAYLKLFKNLPSRPAARQILSLRAYQGLLWLRDTLDRR